VGGKMEQIRLKKVVDTFGKDAIIVL